MGGVSWHQVVFVRDAAWEHLTLVVEISYTWMSFWWGAFWESALWWTPLFKRNLDTAYFLDHEDPESHCSVNSTAGCRPPTWPFHHLLHLPERYVWEPRSYCPLVLAQPGKTPVLSSQLPQSRGKGCKGSILSSPPMEPGFFRVVAAHRWPIPPLETGRGKSFSKQAEMCFSVAFTCTSYFHLLEPQRASLPMASLENLSADFRLVECLPRGVWFPHHSSLFPQT